MTCPAIVAEGDSTIELSTYERITGTITSISCKGFGRHLKGDVHSVTCLATGAWSPAVPTLECTYDLDSKETVYVAVIVVCAALFLFACCWISAAAFCCRSRSRRTWGNRWFGERWFAGQSRDKFVDERIVRYDDDLGTYGRKSFRDEKDRSFRKSYRDDKPGISRRIFDDEWRPVRNNGGSFGRSKRRWSFDDAASYRSFRDDVDVRKSRREGFRDDNLAVTRKSGFYDEPIFKSKRETYRDDRGPLRSGGGPYKRRWSYDGSPIPVDYLGVNERLWDHNRISNRAGESWQYAFMDGDRDMYGKSRRTDRGFEEKGDFRRDMFSKSRMNDRDDLDDFRRSRNNRRYEEWDSLKRYPKNDMENVYDLRRKYDRVFDYEHPRLRESYLPRNPDNGDRAPYGRGWTSNYPVLRGATHETIYSPYGDPDVLRRNRSDTALNRTGRQTQMIESGTGYGGGAVVTSGTGMYNSGFGATRKYGDTIVLPYQQENAFTNVEYAQPQVKVIENNYAATQQVVQSNPAYEVIRLPAEHTMTRRTEYESTDNGPRVMQLDAKKLLPSYRKSGTHMMGEANDDTDYFRGRRDYTIGARY